MIFAMNSMENNAVEIQLSVHDSGLGVNDFGIDYWLIYRRRLAALLSDIKITPLRAEFSYPEPTDIAEYNKLFQCPLFFGKARTVLVFTTGFDNKSESDMSLEEKIRGLTLKRSQHRLDFLSFDALADEFHMSPRTLHRKLRNEGSNYQKIKDSIRYEYVIEHLGNSKLSIKEAAYKSGFLDTSSLNRMFLRWTGTTLDSYRSQVKSIRPFRYQSAQNKVLERVN